MIDRRQTRILIEQQLRTDAELNAFCMDFYPHVEKQFTSQMNRTEKINLLLSLIPNCDDIQKNLKAINSHADIQTTTASPTIWIVACSILAMLLLGAIALANILSTTRQNAAVSPSDMGKFISEQGLSINKDLAVSTTGNSVIKNTGIVNIFTGKVNTINQNTTK